VLVVMLVLTVFTAVQRFAKVWAQASQERPVPARSRRIPRRRTSRRTVAERREAWRTRAAERRRYPRR
jgi:hypothetical protein